MTDRWLALMLIVSVLATEVLAEDSSPLAGLDLALNQRLAFIEVTENKLLRRPVERPGELWRESDTLVMELSEPRWEQRRLSPSRATLVRDRARTRPGTARQQRLSIRLEPDNPAHGLLLALRAALIGDTAALAERMSISPRVTTDGSDEWVVELKPLDEIKGLCGLTLHGKGSAEQSALRQVHVDQCDSWQRIELNPATTPDDQPS